MRVFAWYSRPHHAQESAEGRDRLGDAVVAWGRRHAAAAAADRGRPPAAGVPARQLRRLLRLERPDGGRVLRRAARRAAGPAPGQFPRSLEGWLEYVHPHDHDAVCADLWESVTDRALVPRRVPPAPRGRHLHHGERPGRRAGRRRRLPDQHDRGHARRDRRACGGAGPPGGGGAPQRALQDRQAGHADRRGGGLRRRLARGPRVLPPHARGHARRQHPRRLPRACSPASSGAMPDRPERRGSGGRLHGRRRGQEPGADGAALPPRRRAGLLPPGHGHHGAEGAAATS